MQDPSMYLFPAATLVLAALLFDTPSVSSKLSLEVSNYSLFMIMLVFHLKITQELQRLFIGVANLLLAASLCRSLNVLNDNGYLPYKCQRQIYLSPRYPRILVLYHLILRNFISCIPFSLFIYYLSLSSKLEICRHDCSSSST